MVENVRIGDDTRAADDRERDAGWVQAARSGDAEAFGRLYDAWFDRVFHLVARIVHDHETARDVCQDAFLSAWRGLDGLEDPAAFGGWLLRIARNAAFNRSDREARSRPVDDRGFAVIEGTGSSPTSAPVGFDVTSRLARAEDPDLAASDGAIASLVQETVAALGPRDAEVLDLQLRYDLSPAEIGEVVGLNRNAANQLCHRVRARFATAFGARMLWNGARPECAGLQREMAAAGVDGFGPDAVAVAEQHVQTCDDCDERQRTRVAPAALFAAIPIGLAPAPLKAHVAARLAADGVPMQGSAATTGPSGPPSPSTGTSSLPPPGPPPVTSASVPSDTGRSLPRVAVAAAVVLALGGLFWLLQPGDQDLTALGRDAAVTTTAGSSARTDGGDPDPERTGSAVTSDPGPGTPDGTTPTSPPTTTAPDPVIELVELTPADPQPTTYDLGADSPVLRWTVVDATEVEVWQWFDDGVSGPQRQQLISTDASGEQQACPGTRNPDSTCSTPAGTYSYVIEAKNTEGTTVTSSPVGFEVYQVIL